MSPHILIVDDDLITSSALKQYLEALHYTVSLAEDCKHAREMLCSPQKVDLMILDYLMPDGNGTQLLQSIAEEEEFQRPPVIMSSSIISNRNPSWKKLYQRLSPTAQGLVHAFVSKPYSFEHIDHALKKTLKVVVRDSGNVPQILSGDYIAPIDPADAA